jgi:hypothetical protein
MRYMKIQKPGRFWGVARTLDGELACDAKEERRMLTRRRSM